MLSSAGEGCTPTVLLKSRHRRFGRPDICLQANLVLIGKGIFAKQLNTVTYLSTAVLLERAIPRLRDLVFLQLSASWPGAKQKISNFLAEGLRMTCRFLSVCIEGCTDFFLHVTELFQRALKANNHFMQKLLR